MTQNIIENVREIENLRNQVETHLMTQSVKESKTYYIVYLVDNELYNAIRIDKAMGKIKALKHLLAQLEHIYKLENMFALQMYEEYY
ncbi:MAG: hypothetical protein COV55_02730 [Candidatus Komeilibacteria bacterium CG11_big_fil_rev_8_21_14_0_20_36_20]|uniref:Uncharacterized protein n=1 Tax=Candidatus Komeilibacteria bacterium CG11_big_fil_rev_8_21_14_0_20_36_20 TaxID=1974477 RepID=A0A2H0NEY7_9BACT|nr:MAG: hypothetical protein COV55_02730 [Candidatus Komeilibacteria bacterium CG11_big_fil_rev_8_21_14_0_20_36_20]